MEQLIKAGEMHEYICLDGICDEIHKYFWKVTSKGAKIMLEKPCTMLSLYKLDIVNSSRMCIYSVYSLQNRVSPLINIVVTSTMPIRS